MWVKKRRILADLQIVDRDSSARLDRFDRVPLQNVLV
jgi:hypothetical protein